MKIVRFRTDNNIKMYGILFKNRILALDGDIFSIFSNTEIEIPLEKVKILSPVPHPNKIIGIGLNYKNHIEEWAKKTNQKVKNVIPENPIIFFKPPTSRIGHLGEIELPAESKEVEYEAELAVIIGRECKNISKENALSYIFGYTLGNDITARDIQKKDIQWSRAKGFDTFCPLGPAITLQKGFESYYLNKFLSIKDDDVIENPQEINIKTFLNDRKVQDFYTKDMIFSITEIVSFISNIMTLYPGDVILTGTDIGVGKLNQKDKIEIETEKIGRLTNFVIK